MNDERNTDEQQAPETAPATQQEQADNRIDQLLASIQGMQEQISAMQGSMAMFVESGGTINEGGAEPAKTGTQGDFEYVPIDDLDLF